MRHVTIAEAKEHFDELIALVREGETVVLTEGGQTVIELKATPPVPKKVDIEALKRDLAELRASMPQFTADELAEYRREGQKG
jgi:antitoxin (DNA-binding transcriptional repressor) of toxin-antitoxin stability system